MVRSIFDTNGIPYKTEGWWIGSLNDSESKPLGIKWPTEPIKALGVFFTYDQKLSHLKNFSEKIDDIKKLINIWSSRGLSIHGIVQHCGNTMSSDPVEVQFLFFFWGGGRGVNLRLLKLQLTEAKIISSFKFVFPQFTSSS